MKPGTLIRINGQLDDNTYENWYGEVVGVDENDNIEVGREITHYHCEL